MTVRESRGPEHTFRIVEVELVPGLSGVQSR